MAPQIVGSSIVDPAFRRRNLLAATGTEVSAIQNGGIVHFKCTVGRIPQYTPNALSKQSEDV